MYCVGFGPAPFFPCCPKGVSRNIHDPPWPRNISLLRRMTSFRHSQRVLVVWGSLALASEQCRPKRSSRETPLAPSFSNSFLSRFFLGGQRCSTHNEPEKKTASQQESWKANQSGKSDFVAPPKAQAHVKFASFSGTTGTMIPPQNKKRVTGLTKKL